MASDPPSENPPLFTLVYLSRESTPLGPDGLATLLEQSREKNARLGITGLLVLKAGYFLQILEGARAAVEPLMRRIAEDPRHRDVVVLATESGGGRQFAGWAMALADWPDEDAATTAAWRAVLEEIRASGGRMGSGGGLKDFIASLAGRGYLA